jgi:hypothetical protein
MAMTNVYTGANGVLMFTPEQNPEGADAGAILDPQMYGITVVGRVTGVELYVQTHLSAYHEIGQRHPTSLHSGNINISGKIGRAYINGALLFLLLGRGADAVQRNEPYVQPALLMSVSLQDTAVPSTASALMLEGVKFENWAYQMPEDDFVMENVTFKALHIRVQDEEAPAPDGERVIKNTNFPNP